MLRNSAFFFLFFSFSIWQRQCKINKIKINICRERDNRRKKAPSIPNYVEMLAEFSSYSSIGNPFSITNWITTHYASDMPYLICKGMILLIFSIRRKLPKLKTNLQRKIHDSFNRNDFYEAIPFTFNPASFN